MDAECFMAASGEAFKRLVMPGYSLATVVLRRSLAECVRCIA